MKKWGNCQSQVPTRPTIYTKTTTDFRLETPFIIQDDWVEDPHMPDIATHSDGKVEIPKAADNATITRVDGTNNISIRDNLSGVQLIIQLDSISEVDNYTGKPVSVNVVYPELKNELPQDSGKLGYATNQINMNLKDVTTDLPIINSSMNKTVKDEFTRNGLELMAMIVAEGPNVESINGYINDMRINFTIPVDWCDSMLCGVFWYHRADNGTIIGGDRVQLDIKGGDKNGEFISLPLYLIWKWRR